MRLGFPTEIGYPPLRENFTHVIEHGMRQHGLPLIKERLDDSFLVDMGYVDGDELRAAHLAASTTGDGLVDLYQFINWELGVRAFDNV